MKKHFLQFLTAAFLVCALPFVLNAADVSKVGDKAPDFTLKTLDDQTVHLGELTAKSKVVLIVLRGWPGYQCPVCDRQVHEFIVAAPGFAEAKARVVMVYPGPAGDLKAHVKEFAEMKNKIGLGT